MSSETIVDKTNSVLTLNKPTGLDLHITDHGSDWLWTVFSIFGVVLLYQLLFFNISKNKKLIHGISAIPAVFLLVLYFAMLSDLGWTSTVTEFNNIKSSTGSYNRQIFYAKYIAWVFSYPSLMILLDIVANEDGKLTFNGDYIVFVIVETLSSILFAVSLLIGALIHSTYKWGFFVFGVAGASYSVGNLLARIIVHHPGKLAMIFLTLFSSIVWLLYLVSWGLSEGGNVIQSDSETVFYGILDVVQFLFIPLIFSIFSKYEHPVEIKFPERIETQTIVKTINEGFSSDGSGTTASATPRPEQV